MKDEIIDRWMEKLARWERETIDPREQELLAEARRELKDAHSA